MTKYVFLGLLFTIIFAITGGLALNHMSSTHSMAEITVGLESTAIGVMRESDGEESGVRARDLIAELTAQVAEKQPDTQRVIVVSYKFFDEDDSEINFDVAMNENRLVHSVQYKVELYLDRDVDGNTVVEGATPQSSTENRISLNRHIN